MGFCIFLRYCAIGALLLSHSSRRSSSAPGKVRMRKEATTALDIAETLRLARRQVRRTRSFWFLCSLLVYYCGSALSFFNLDVAPRPALFLNWLVILLLSGGLMVMFSTREDQRLAALETLVHDELP